MAGRPVRLWRVSPAQSLKDACHSTTAGRWSWASRDVLYTSCTPELAVLEALAHRAENSATHWLCAIDVSATARARRVKDLPDDWRVQQSLTRRIGNDWFDRLESPLLLVPSALCEEATNALINPAHPGIRRLRMQVLRRFHFDRRL
jgi:RES domain-containing protein